MGANLYQMITFQQALQIIKRKDRLDRPMAFDIDFVTANARSGKAGDVKDYSNMVYMLPKTTNATRDAKHFLNGTINIMPNGGGPITKVHLQLIRKVNGMTVT